MHAAAYGRVVYAIRKTYSLEGKLGLRTRCKCTTRYAFTVMRKYLVSVPPHDISEGIIRFGKSRVPIFRQRRGEAWVQLMAHVGVLNLPLRHRNVRLRCLLTWPNALLLLQVPK